MRAGGERRSHELGRGRDVTRFWAVLVAYFVGLAWGAAPRFDRGAEVAVGIFLMATIWLMATARPVEEKQPNEGGGGGT